MVRVVVRDQQMIDTLDTGVLHRLLDAFSVTATVIGPSRVHQQRFSRGSHEQRGLAAFYVDEVDQKMSSAGSALRPRRIWRKRREEREDEKQGDTDCSGEARMQWKPGRLGRVVGSGIHRLQKCN